MDKIQLKRLYEDSADNDGYRVLVHRLWPRGMSKEDAELDYWCKELAPSDKLREWFEHNPDKWEEFQSRYRDELNERRTLYEQVPNDCEENTLTLLFATKNREHNNAVLLKKYSEELSV